MNSNPYASVLLDIFSKARDLRDAKEKLRMPETIALLRARLDPIADQLDAREQFSPMIGDAADKPLPGVAPQTQLLAEHYRTARKMDAMFGHAPGTVFLRALERSLHEVYGIPTDQAPAG